LGPTRGAEGPTFEVTPTELAIEPALMLEPTAWLLGAFFQGPLNMVVED
jgi:hypothetical protein